MSKSSLTAILVFTMTLIGCIGTDFIDDFVMPQLSIEVGQDTLVIGNRVQFEAMFRNNIGIEETVSFAWESSNEDVAVVDGNGWVEALAVGTSTITANYSFDTFNLQDSYEIVVLTEVEPILVPVTSVDTIGLNDSVQFQVLYRNSNAEFETVNIQWESNDESIATVSTDGFVKGIAKGNATITASYDDGNEVLKFEFDVVIEEETIVEFEQRSGTIKTTSSYDLTGDFVLEEQPDGTLKLEFSSNYIADTALPGLYVYLTNNRNSVAPNVAYEIGKVTVFNGSHSYTLPSSIGIDDYQYVFYYCKPFTVKVGDGEIN